MEKVIFCIVFPRVSIRVGSPVAQQDAPRMLHGAVSQVTGCCDVNRQAIIEAEPEP